MDEYPYDFAYAPISEADISTEIKNNSTDAIVLYQLIRRTASQKVLMVAFNSLNELRQADQGNAVVLAAYCLAFDIAGTDHYVAKFNPTAEEEEARQTAMEDAYRLAPNLWLTYAVEGRQLVNQPGSEAKAFSLLQKAVELAPDVSIVHDLLANCYLVYDSPFKSIPKALEEEKKALKLKPVISNAPFTLLWIYLYATPDEDAAIYYKKAFLNTVPPYHKLEGSTQKVLDRVK